jgi:hypothetical protein
MKISNPAMNEIKEFQSKNRTNFLKTTVSGFGNLNQQSTISGFPSGAQSPSNCPVHLSPMLQQTTKTRNSIMGGTTNTFNVSMNSFNSPAPGENKRFASIAASP